MDPNALPSATEAEIQQLANVLRTGVVPVAHRELMEVVKLMNDLAEAMSNSAKPGVVTPASIKNFAPVWAQLFEVLKRAEAIHNESSTLNLVDKIVLVLKVYGALTRNFAAIKELKACRFTY